VVSGTRSPGAGDGGDDVIIKLKVGGKKLKVGAGLSRPAYFVINLRNLLGLKDIYKV
jgi:hypothetical protein